MFEYVVIYLEKERKPRGSVYIKLEYLMSEHIKLKLPSIVSRFSKAQ